MNKKSFEGYYKKSIKERQEILSKELLLTNEEQKLLEKESSLSFDIADRMIENVIGTFPLPLGLATNFVIDEKEYVIPFAIEEPSVIAAASNAAKLSNGFITENDEQIMIGQLQLINLENACESKKKILENKEKILKEVEKVDPILVKFGGGPRDLKVNILDTPRGKMIEVQLLVNVGDAMGANAINTMLEKITSVIEEISGGKHVARIISNLAIYRRTQSKTIWTKEKLEESVKGTMKGEEIIERILDLYEFAVATPFRCATHNKGIMNGIDSVVIATGNDFRAIEAGAHAYASYKGKYSPLTKYYKNSNGDLVGEIDIPLALGLVGGAIKVHPIAKLNAKILGLKKVQDLASVIASVGLAQNFAAMRAIATTGIQSGHMKLHAKNIAVQAGAIKEEIELVAQKMIELKEVNQLTAEKIIEEIRE
ncbi:MAG: hydroxymethylglutaryl-CoA reductase, degradative [Candidatus ainarchaeum sp.]|nr:hydroxymethylglutaryl-CoA reductase, degradative [Candidatus ainarchaeum sp.]